MPRRPCRLDWSTSWSRTVRCKARRNEWRGNPREVERVPLADGAETPDLGFGEDYELLAATAHPGRFAEIGRCEEGSGVELLRGGQRVELNGWEHFAE